ncbi:AraC family transcriptional regulator [Paenibacillus sp. PAMC21692]|uniref:helix-turn-helix transcriptional regulator n=1 Tax=Paenibacillus sp. PAMC21692 TaxID=2762320 RepID=UPI00164E2D53|nr:AraC family transcriptional regulator [Paenibacillus sp. PAMC21692]QNK55730.1 AraC family transcriptional regulator ligand-binding domain-containing protein [Paenibacillus sp. PAMC21692]
MTFTSDRVKVPHGLWEGIRQLGIQPGDIVRQAGLPQDEITDAEVSVSHYYAIWQALAELAGNTAQAIIGLATAFETAKYPPSVLATYHARDFRDALNRMTKYKQLCPPENLTIHQEGDICRIELGWQQAIKSGPPVLVGITLACLMELGRRGTGWHLTAKSVEFTEDMGDVEALEAYFGCRIRTGAPHDRLTLRQSDLDRPFLSYNEELLEILTPVLEHALDQRNTVRTISNAVKYIIKGMLSSGRPGMKAVAKELGMSERTLQRRLAQEATTFNVLLSQTRHEQALYYLADDMLEIKEVAYLVGYEDQNSFYRAFRGWEGVTPAYWRVSQEH